MLYFLLLVVILVLSVALAAVGRELIALRKYLDAVDLDRTEARKRLAASLIVGDRELQRRLEVEAELDGLRLMLADEESKHRKIVGNMLAVVRSAIPTETRGENDQVDAGQTGH